LYRAGERIREILKSVMRTLDTDQIDCIKSELSS
jgi:hypothetical protein